MTDIGLGWAFSFESTKRKVKKVYPKLDLLLHYLLNPKPQLSIVVMKIVQILRGVRPHPRVVLQNYVDAWNAIEPLMTNEFNKVVQAVSISFCVRTPMRVVITGLGFFFLSFCHLISSYFVSQKCSHLVLIYEVPKASLFL